MALTPIHALAIICAGAAAGVTNAIVGSGTLITFPTLVAFGYSPITANVSNTLGLVPGNIASVIGYRREMAGQRVRTVRLGLASVVGAAIGAILLLSLPASAFRAIVPIFIAIGVIAVFLGPSISRRLASAQRTPSAAAGGVATFIGVLLCGAYGGYFGAGQGLLFISVLGIALIDTIHRLNALRNVLVGLANVVAAVVFMLSADVSWTAAGLVAAGSISGGWTGVQIGRRIPAPAYRGVIGVVGVFALIKLL